MYLIELYAVLDEYNIRTCTIMTIETLLELLCVNLNRRKSNMIN